MKLRVFLLYPFALMYRLITGFRNHLYNIGYSRSFNYDIMTITVGNLSMGGTGKTPMVEYIAQLLMPTYALALLSRGYKRKTVGFRIAEKGTSAADIGDEPYQMYKKFGDKLTVAVGEDRALAIPKILLEHPETQVIVLDDAYQHRRVKADFNILLNNYYNPFYQDFILPSGNLREARTGANRADVIVITKCPHNLSLQEKKNLKQSVVKYAGRNTPVFFSSVVYGVPVSYSGNHKFTGKLLLFAGLANSSSLVDYVSNTFTMIDFVEYSDHYDYTIKDIELLNNKANEKGAQLLTTEKDIAKIRSNAALRKLISVDLFYLPISVQFLFNEAQLFNKQLEKAIETKYTVEKE